MRVSGTWGLWETHTGGFMDVLTHARHSTAAHCALFFSLAPSTSPGTPELQPWESFGHPVNQIPQLQDGGFSVVRKVEEDTSL